MPVFPLPCVSSTFFSPLLNLWKGQQMQEVKLTPFYWQGAANRGLNAPLALLPLLLSHLG